MSSSWQCNPVHLLRLDRLAEQAARPATHKVAQRTCLGCQKKFDSRWIGNRLCPHCGGSGAKLAKDDDE